MVYKKRNIIYIKNTGSGKSDYRLLPSVFFRCLRLLKPIPYRNL